MVPPVQRHSLIYSHRRSGINNRFQLYIKAVRAASTGKKNSVHLLSIIMRMIRPVCKGVSVLFCFLFCLVFTRSIQAQTSISGIINSYAAVSSITGTNLTVSTTTGFSVGQKILIIQMKGVTISTANTSTYGDITAYNDCGNFEFAYIANIVGTTVTLVNPLVKTYSTSGLVQIVSVPFYCGTTVDGTLTCQAWNGTTGGVLVFESGGFVTLNADIDVSGLGFRGQVPCGTGNLNCNNSNWYVSVGSCNGAWKGEGVAEYVNTNQSGGRAKLANGGGGSNPNNAGGAGGGNYGAGGDGGYGDNSCSTTNIQAIGGLGLNYTLGKVFMGGAGGNGQGNNSGTMFGGTNGGGIVMISALYLDPNGHSILANGIDQSGQTTNEGAGGGGAGGTVCLDIPNLVGPLNVFADGGDGGSTNNDPLVTDCTGPGGGGGGGVLWVAGGAANPLITFSSNGGAAGLALSTTSTCYNTSYNAENGTGGNIIFNYPPHVLPPPLFSADLGPDITACPTEPVVLDPGAGFSTYLWQDGSTDTFFTAIGPGTYSVFTTDINGCISYDTIDITPSPAFSFTIGSGDTTICPSQTVVIDPGTYSAYVWQDGSTLPTFTATDTGTYSVTVVDSVGCTGSSTYDIFFTPPFTYTISDGDTIICPDQPVSIDAGAGYAQYLWSDGSASQILLTTDTGTYSVTVTDMLGCSGSSSYIVYYYQGSFVNIGNDTALCEGDSIILDAGIFPQYTWSDGTTNSSITVYDPGVYYVTIFDFNTCIISDTISIDSFYSAPPENLVSDTTICGTQVVTILAPQGYAEYVWSNGSTLNYIDVTEPGTYFITITNDNTCSTTDFFNVVTKCPTGIYIPNAFTPNNDGMNDVFIPFGYGITTFHMKIFNRWGQLVFETDNINSGWSGDCKQTECETGSYVYYIEWTGQQDGVTDGGTEVGNVTLIK
jgi:gliding motility-associated-like protein